MSEERAIKHHRMILTWRASFWLNRICHSTLAPGMRPGAGSGLHSAPARLKSNSSPAPIPQSEAAFALGPCSSIRICPLARRRRTSRSASRNANFCVTELYGHVIVTTPPTTREAQSGRSGLSCEIGVGVRDSREAAVSPSTDAMFRGRGRVIAMLGRQVGAAQALWKFLICRSQLKQREETSEDGSWEFWNRKQQEGVVSAWFLACLRGGS